MLRDKPLFTFKSRIAFLVVVTMVLLPPVAELFGYQNERFYEIGSRLSLIGATILTLPYMKFIELNISNEEEKI